MNFFGLGPLEIGIILVVALLIFGPKKLPELGRSLGKTAKSFQKASQEFQDELNKEMKEAEKALQMNAQLESGKAKTPESSGSIDPQD